MKSALAIIDADSIIYLVASKYKEAKVRSSALNSLDDFIMDILKVNYAKEYFGFFGKIKGGKNFRYELATTLDYKGNRGDKEDWYLYWEKVMKNHMEQVWGFIPVEYVEADDMCTIAATAYVGNPKYSKVIICSPDKDLKQQPDVWIYNYKKRTTEYINEEKGLRNLYTQCIEGDSADNIPGIPGVGEKGANEFIASVANYKHLHKAVKAFFVEMHHTIIPEKKAKSAEKIYLANYKMSMGITRFTKATKLQALQAFPKGGKMFMPSVAKFGENQFDEMLSLVYMLRTPEELQAFWPGYKLPKPVKEKYIDWKEVDLELQLMEEGIEEEDFGDVEDLFEDDFAEIDDDLMDIEDEI
ncbi:MAG: hypothetical protein KAH32_04465 [Chlamydiia bacterium]|nr:hypothetical protein [Chlamydiia bacterium]